MVSRYVSDVAEEEALAGLEQSAIEACAEAWTLLEQPARQYERDIVEGFELDLRFPDPGVDARADSGGNAPEGEVCRMMKGAKWVVQPSTTDARE